MTAALRLADNVAWHLRTSTTSKDLKESAMTIPTRTPSRSQRSHRRLRGWAQGLRDRDRVRQGRPLQGCSAAAAWSARFVTDCGRGPASRGKPDDSGTAAALHRGWINLRTAVRARTKAGSRMRDHAVKVFRDALAAVAETARVLVARQTPMSSARTTRCAAARPGRKSASTEPRRHRRRAARASPVRASHIPDEGATCRPRDPDAIRRLDD